ncbi:MAG: hypothetical protein M3015_08360 [Bacteroidota bacterium]|nr:hypothetical protein [Bacteroidota bacterium]
MKNIKYILLTVLLTANSLGFSQTTELRPFEKNGIEIFNDFVSHIHVAILKKSGITDTAELRFMVGKYLFTNSKVDSIEEGKLILSDLGYDNLNYLKSELTAFYRYLQEREDQHLAENLAAMPARLAADTSIYNQFTSFQKVNTFVFYDKRSPQKVLGYLLFMPPYKGLIHSPKIWSWTLVFKFGKFTFRSVTGQEGYEYLYTPDE